MPFSSSKICAPLLRFRRSRTPAAQAARFAAQDSRLLDLPVDILEPILSFLDIPDLYLLGQTCRALRRLTSRNWRAVVLAPPPATWGNFFYGIAFAFPDKWVCGRCLGRLHPLDQDDLPQNDQYQVLFCQRAEDRHLGQPYRLRETHIQLALKLSQPRHAAAAGQYAGYLTNLLKPYSTILPPDDSLIATQERFHAAPKIVKGRFLLHIAWRLTKTEGTVSFFDLRGKSVCPHLRINPVLHWMSIRHQKRPDGPGGFEWDAQRAFDSDVLGSEVPGCCGRCPTDYTIQVLDGVIVLCIWYDFGPEKPPDDELWRVHIRDPCIK